MVKKTHLIRGRVFCGLFFVLSSLGFQGQPSANGWCDVQPEEPLSRYLAPTDHLDYNHPIFAETMAKLVSDGLSIEEKLAKLYYFTRDAIPFADSASLTASGALKEKKALCYTKAMIFVSFCRRLGVPARLARIRFHVLTPSGRSEDYHGIAQVFVDGKWLYVDTVSNHDSWRFWKFPGAETWTPPRFSLKRDVVVSPEHYQDMTFEDDGTNDVPANWLKSMRQRLATGKW